MSIRSDELVAFTEQFSNLIDAGIPLSNALAALEQQEENKEFKNILKQVFLDIDSGTTLSESLAKQPKVFSRFFVSMVYAGEQGAGLPKVLKRVAEYLEREAALKAKVRGVFAYPLMVGILAMVIIFFLVIFVAPVFADVYHQLNVLLPGPTIILLSISFMVRKFWLVLTAVIGGLYLFYHYYKNKEIGRLFFGWLSMNLPILGKFNSKVAVARFVRSLGDMLSCGVPVVDSLSITDKVVGNQVISSATAKIKTSVESGGKLTTALLKNEIFSPMVIQMVYAGEESGSLAEMLEKCADTLDRDVELSAKRLIVMLEPSLTLILAAVVGFIALAIYLPMFDLVRVVSQ